MAGPYKQINKKKLLEQATFMLEITPAAFVFLYRPAGIWVVPAVAVVAAGGEPRSVPSWDYTTFFLEFFRCFVGDSRWPRRRTNLLWDGWKNCIPAEFSRLQCAVKTTDHAGPLLSGGIEPAG